VNQANTSTTVSTLGSPTVYGQSASFTATVSITSPGAGTPTGNVDFYDGSVIPADLIGTEPLSGSAPFTATFTTTGLSAGDQTIYAVYEGDGNFAPSTTSTPASQTVNQASTSTTVSTSGSPTVWGQSVSFTATVSIASPGGGTPTGDVDFYDGSVIPADLVGTEPLSASAPFTATYTTTGLSVGSHTIYAVYAGDGNFVGSTTSSPASQTVNQVDTSTTVSTADRTSVSGQSVSFTATVWITSPGAGTPTGDVDFYDGLVTGADLVGTEPLSGITPFTATFTTTDLSVGNHTIYAEYAGDNNFASSTTLSPAGQTVNQASSQTIVTSSVNPSVSGQLVTFTATVVAVAPGDGTPTGTVTFYDGGGPIGEGTLTSPGVWSLAINSLAVGQHADITAAYNGDANFQFSESEPFLELVNPATTLSTLTPLPNPSNVGQTVTFTATVAAVVPGTGTPTGTVTFLDGATVLGTGTLSGGVATFTDSALAAGSHSISFTYGGDANFQGSSSAAVSQTVQVSTSSTVVPSVTTTTTGQPITLSVTIVGGVAEPSIVPSISFAASPAASTPTGTVTFYDGNTLLGTAPVNQYGVATLVIPSLPPGQSTITAAYSGDAVYGPSVSNIANITVLSADVDGPTVANVQRYGYHHQATSIVISFNDALEAASAETLSNYSLVGPANKHGKGGHPISIGAAVYNAASNTLTLSLTQPWNLHQRWTLTINGTGPNGVKNTAGVLLDGAGDGGAGTNYVTTLTGKDLAGNASSLPKVVHAKVKELFHHVHSAVRKGR